MNEFIKKKSTDYSVVIPKNAAADCLFAVDELKMIVKASCGIELNVISDNENLPKKCLHIGDTRQALAENIKPSFDLTGSDGFVLKKRGENFYISSFGSEGVIYGVYEFCSLVFGAEFFGYGAWDIPKTENAFFPKNDVIKKPSFAKRARSVSWEEYDLPTERRFGYNLGNGLHWVEFDHSHFHLIPKSKYFVAHRDWYSADGAQLCLSNPEMLAEMKKNVIARLTPDQFEYGDTIAFSVGHEDNGSFCSCPKCLENIKKYGGKSGVMMRFINEIADTVNEYVKENYPDKTVKIVTFGYGPTLVPPVVKTADGGYAAADESVIAHKNVGIFFAPLGPNWAYSLLDGEKNKVTADAIKGWKAIKPELFVWTYDGIFYAGNVPMDNWEFLQDGYKSFHDAGATYLFDQYNGTNFDFNSLRHYVRGKLMWNVNLDLEELIRHFMKHYYKEAADKVYEYFNSFRAHTATLKKSLSEKGDTYQVRSFTRYEPLMASGEYWSKEFLTESLKNLIAARAQTEKDGTAYKRVEAEMITPIYLLMTIYGIELTKEQIAEYTAVYERVITENSKMNCGKYGLYYKILADFRSMLYEKELLDEENNNLCIS